MMTKAVVAFKLMTAEQQPASLFRRRQQNYVKESFYAEKRFGAALCQLEIDLRLKFKKFNDAMNFTYTTPSEGSRQIISSS